MRDGVVAILLAAGQGTRLGGPKALLLVRAGAAGAHDGAETPLIEAQCRDCLAAESARAIAVLRADVAALVTDRLHAAGAEVVISDAAEELGPAGSLAAAARHLAAATFHAAVVTPVDVRVEAPTVAKLALALAPASALAVVPRFGGRRGHPVVLAPEALARYRQPDPPPLRDHLRALGDRVVAVDVDDAAVTVDLDFAHQTDALLRITGMPGPPLFFGRLRALD